MFSCDSPPLENAGAANFFRGKIGNGEQDNRHDGFHHANGDAERNLTVADTEVVNIKVKHLDIFFVHRVAKGKELVDARIKEVANAHDQKHKEGWDQQRDRDVADLLPTGSTVYHGSLINTLINASDGGKIDNGIPAKGFPKVEKCLDQPDVLICGEDVEPLLNAHFGKHGVDDTTAAKKTGGQREHNDPTDKVGQRSQGLYCLLELGVFDLAEENRKQHGQRHKQIVQKLDTEGVPQNTQQIAAHDGISEQCREVLPADKLAAEQGAPRLILKKRIAPAPQGQILENKDEDQAGQHIKKQLVAFHFFAAAAKKPRIRHKASLLFYRKGARCPPSFIRSPFCSFAGFIIDGKRFCVYKKNFGKYQRLRVVKNKKTGAFLCTMYKKAPER